MKINSGLTSSLSDLTGAFSFGVGASVLPRAAPYMRTVTGRNVRSTYDKEGGCATARQLSRTLLRSS